MNNIDNQEEFYSSIPRKHIRAYNCRFALEHFFGYRPFLGPLRRWEERTKSRIYNSVKEIKRLSIAVPSIEMSMNPIQIRDKYIRKGTPFVIKGGALGWTAFEKWDFDFFENNYGEHPVIITNHNDLGDETDGPSIRTNLREIIRGIDQNSMQYARFNPLLDSYPVLQDDLDQEWLNEVRDTELKKHHALFIGNKGTKTNIHNAGNDNIFVQIRGRKKWYLWDQRAYVIINPTVNRAPAKSSPVDPRFPTGENFPAFNHLPTYELILEPGDILFVPAYLWHYVENLTPTIGIGNRWLSPHNTIRNNSLFAILELFNTSPTIFQTLNWRKGFDFNKIMLKNQGE